MTSLYALGWTQHSVGAQNIRAMAMIQLLLGNVGMAGGGVNALRGHSNIQGLTDLGVLSDLLPGYLTVPKEADKDVDTYLASRTLKPLRPGQMSYWQNYPKFFVSLQKAWWGTAATKENSWAYEYLPKLDKVYDILAVFDLMHQGKMNATVHLPGLQPARRRAEQGEEHRGAVQAQVPRRHRSAHHRDLHVLAERGRVQPGGDGEDRDRGLPAAVGLLRRGGRLAHELGRTLQWHYKGAEPPGEAMTDLEILGELFFRIRTLYAKEGGAFPDPILKLTWPYAMPRSRRPRRWRASTTAGRSPISPIRRTRRRSP